MESVKV
jgi:hypothetical protein